MHSLRLGTRAGARGAGRDDDVDAAAAHRQRRRDAGLSHRGGAARARDSPRVLQRRAGRLPHRAHRGPLRVRRSGQPVSARRLPVGEPSQPRGLLPARRVLRRAVDHGAAALRLRPARRHRGPPLDGAGARHSAVAPQLGRTSRSGIERRDRRLRAGDRRHLRQRAQAVRTDRDLRLHRRSRRRVRVLGVRAAARSAGHRLQHLLR